MNPPPPPPPPPPGSHGATALGQQINAERLAPLTQRTAESTGVPEPVVAAAFHMETPLTPEQQLESDVNKWNETCVWLAKMKKMENELRWKIARAVTAGMELPTGALPEGTNTAPPRPGATVDIHAKVVQKYNHKIEESLMVVTLNEAELTPEEGNGLIKTTYEISMGALKKLPAEKQEIVRKMITSKPGSIELEIKTTPKP